jgi:8-oxo-dGTP pyrophosphatase MutT (NUDIX family)
MYETIEKLANYFIKASRDFWGKQASGMIFLCPDDNTILLCKRSPNVQDPNTWGIPGGAVKELGNGFYSSEEEEIKPDNDLLQSTALIETKEELGTLPNINIINSTDFKSGSFLYRTYISTLSLEEKEEFTKKIILNWENTEFKWFDLNQLPSNLHFGVSYVLNKTDDSESDDFDYGPRPHYVSPSEKSTNNYGYMNIHEMPAINQNES